MSEPREEYLVERQYEGWLPGDESEVELPPGVRAVLEAVEAWIDSIEEGYPATLQADEELIKAWYDYRPDMKPIPCGICHRYECSH